jgi:5-methylcytosine-specific restriction endonuclease McrA
MLYNNLSTETETGVLHTLPNPGQINLYERSTDVPKSYHNAAHRCYHVTSRVEVQCSECGTRWMKSKYTLPEWQGRCRSCAQKFEGAKPERKAAKSKLAREQVLRQGGVPNAVKLTSERTRGENNVNWKNGKRGPAASNWRGGHYPKAKSIRNSEAYREWRTAIFQRDDFTCQLCSDRGGRLHVDHYPVPFSHIFNEFVELNIDAKDHPPFWDTDNGRTLCESCHRKYGWKQSKRNEKKGGSV